MAVRVARARFLPQHTKDCKAQSDSLIMYQVYIHIDLLSIASVLHRKGPAFVGVEPMVRVQRYRRPCDLVVPDHISFAASAFCGIVQLATQLALGARFDVCSLPLAHKRGGAGYSNRALSDYEPSVCGTSVCGVIVPVVSPLRGTIGSSVLFAATAPHCPCISEMYTLQ